MQKKEVNGNEIKANELKNEAEILRKNDKEIELAIKFQEMKIGSIEIEKEFTSVNPEEPKTPEIPKIVGLIHRRRWDFRTIDKELIPDPYVIINKVIDNKKLRGYQSSRWTNNNSWNRDLRSKFYCCIS